MKTPTKIIRIVGILGLGCIAAWITFSKTSRWGSLSERSVCQHCGLTQQMFRRTVNNFPYRIRTSFATAFNEVNICDHRWIRIEFNSHVKGGAFALGGVAGRIEIQIFLNAQQLQAGMRSFAAQRNLPTSNVWSNFLAYYSQDLGTQLIRSEHWFSRGEETHQESFSNWLNQHYDLMVKTTPTTAHQ